MTEGTLSNVVEGAEDPARMQRILTAFRQVGLPLLQSMSESQGAAAAAGNAQPIDPQKFTALVDSTVALSRALAANLVQDESQIEAWVHWALAGASSQAVAARYKVSGQPMQAEDAQALAGLVVELQEKFKIQIPVGSEPVPNTVATFRAKMMESMVPVVGAMAQYSFGRAEHSLLAEVAERLAKTADQVTRALAPSGCTPEQWRLLCWNVLRAAGQVYADSHYAEADRLLYMNPDERASYFAQHSNLPPMTQVWQSFNQRMAMLATLATYLEVPAAARLDAESWQS
jgi:hypothetical protein